MHRIAALFVVMLLVLSGGGNFADPAPVTPVPLLPIPGTPQPPDPLSGFRGLQPTPAAVTPAAPNTSRFDLPQWGLIYSDDFDAYPVDSLWAVHLDPYLVADADPYLHIVSAPTFLPLLIGQVADLELQAHVTIASGSLTCSVRIGIDGSIDAEFFADGTFQLRERGQLIAIGQSAALLSPSGATITLKVADDVVTIVINDEALITAQTANAPAAGTIAFVVNDSGGLPDIRLDNLRLEGTHLTAADSDSITTRSVYACPTGDTITYVGYNTVPHQIVAIDPVTGAYSTVIDGMPGIFDPSWSADRQKLVFHSVATTEHSRVYVLNCDTGQITPITPSTRSSINASWSPAGDRIAYFSSPYTYVQDLSQQTPTETLVTVGEPTSWSPDGRYLLIHKWYPYPAHWELWRVDVSAAIVGQPNAETWIADGLHHNADWSPDGTTIVALQWEATSYQYHLLTIPASGGTTTYLNVLAHTADSPSWSPDGASIAFQEQSNLFIYDVASGAKTNLTPEFGDAQVFNPDWGWPSPDCGSDIRAASAACQPVSNGLHAVYFDGFQVLDDMLERPLSFDPAIDFSDAADWALGSEVHQFSARWTGRFVPGADITPPPAVQDLTLTFSGLDFQTDGLRVWWDGQPIINTWGDHQTGTQFGTAVSATIPAVSAGQPYPLWIEYHHFDRSETTVPQLSLSYSYNGASGAVPTAWLSPSDPEGVIPYADPYVIAPPNTPPVRTLDQLAACVDGKAVVVPVFPGATVEHTDLLAVADETEGLIVHDGPTWNSPLELHRAWGTAADLDGVYIEFPRTGFTSEVWYRQPGDQWINLRSEDFYYVIGASDTVANPCDLPLIAATDTITFTYDRERAARYAIAHAYRNSIPINESGEPYPGEPRRVTNRITPLLYQVVPYGSETAYARFAYQAYTGGPNATGSALLPSEAIWIGGMPMTYNNDPLQNLDTNAKCLSSESNNFNIAGWRYCDEESLADRGGETGPWRGHVGLVAYYSSPLTFSADNTVLDQRGSEVAIYRLFTNNQFDPNFRAFSSLDDLEDLGAPALDVQKQEFFDTFINPANPGQATITGITLVTTGDYVYINRGSADELGHGFLIVGWGEVSSCPAALSKSWRFDEVNNPETEGQLFASFASATGHPVVPYVVDFSGMIDPATSEYGNQLQRPKPRPFYCARYANPDYFNVVRDGFAFYTFPDAVILDSPLRLYVSSGWTWVAANE